MRMLYQGLSDVATILARRVAVEFSDSDDGPSDSEYDSDDWGKDSKYSPQHAVRGDISVSIPLHICTFVKV